MVILMNIDMVRKRKLLIILFLIMIISFIVGCLFISILSDNNQELVKDSINSYFDGVSKGSFTYLKSLYSMMTSNLILTIFTWIMGISIIGVLLVSLILIYKSFIVGFSFTSILYTYGFKGVFVAGIYIIPEIINLFVTFLVVYYSISFSVLLFNNLFRKKEFNKRVVVTRYLKLLIITIGINIISSLISVFLIPNILRLF